MNKKILVGILVVIAILIGWMIYSSKSDDSALVGLGNQNSTTTDKTGQNTSNTTSTTGTQTFKSLITQKGSYKCTYEVASSTGKSTDVVYIADGRLRGEFRTSGIAGNMMVYDGATLFQWKEGLSVGTKESLTSLSQLPSIIPKDLTSGASYGSGIDNVGWDCHQWIKVSSMLVPPSTVKFTLVK